MFSERSRWPMSPNPLISLLEKKRNAGEQIFDLTESNPTRAGFQYDPDVILGALNAPRSLIYEPSPQGLPETRRAIAGYYQDRGVPVDPDSLFLTASTSEAYAFLFKLLANPGDEILIPAPGYPLFEFLSQLESVKFHSYPSSYDSENGWQIDLEILSATISTKTVAIVVVNPNNPTGVYLKEYEFEFINQLCMDHKLALIIDEVFWDYRTATHLKNISEGLNNPRALTFVLNGFSKLLGLPQLKLGWIHLNGPEELRSEARARLEIIADTYLSVSTPVQHAAERLFTQKDTIQEQILSRIQTNLFFLNEETPKAPGWHVLRREGGWYAVLQIPEHISDEEMTINLLEKENVLIHPGYFYDFPGDNCLVLSLLTAVDIFREGVIKMLKCRDKE
ncbi:MAG: pyridoxal phosphate-dependent aminotransferase [Calditrichia bacterium]